MQSSRSFKTKAICPSCRKQRWRLKAAINRESEIDTSVMSTPTAFSMHFATILWLEVRLLRSGRCHVTGLADPFQLPAAAQNAGTFDLFQLQLLSHLPISCALHAKTVNGINISLLHIPICCFTFLSTSLLFAPVFEMGHFDDCTPDQRFTSTDHDSIYNGVGTIRTIIDWDQRRFIAVATAWQEEDEDFFFDALAEHIDDIPPDIVLIEVGEQGQLLHSTAALDEDRTKVPFYPSPSDYPSTLRRVQRKQLIELDRMGVQVDLCKDTSTTEPTQVAYKYYINEGNIRITWDESNCLLHIPKHPNIVPFHSLVIDQVKGEDKVVGFTTPFIPGGTILDNISRPFKLKHLKQLTSTIDYLNLTLGIVHRDITLYNLLINPTTDDLLIFDFNLACRFNKDNKSERYDPARNDVKFAAFTLYEIITRDTHLRDENYPHELDASMVLQTDGSAAAWEKHEDVVLDAPVEDYRRHLDEWMARRADAGAEGEVGSRSQAPCAVDWPPLPEFPMVPFCGIMISGSAQLRQTLVRRGARFVAWQRPSSWALPLPAGKKLLATGEVVEGSR